MCELMGLCFHKPVAADVSIRAFAARDAENADGWGLAWYDADRSLSLVKEPLSWRRSKYARFLEDYEHLRSTMFIAHVRHATVGGEPKRADTHPFARELAGRYYCFAHNGTVRDAFTRLPLGRYSPIGGTDSEHVFCHLLDELAQRGDELGNRDVWCWLHRKFDAFNAMGKFNCLLSDGRRLIVYHDINGFKGLHMRLVGIHDHEVRHLDDPTFQIDLSSDSANRGVVIATAPLSATGWHRLKPGEMLVLGRGRLLFSSHRSPEARTAACATPVQQASRHNSATSSCN